MRHAQSSSRWLLPAWSEQWGGVAIQAVHLRLGALSGVVKEALLSCYDMACEGTRLAGSRLVI